MPEQIKPISQVKRMKAIIQDPQSELSDSVPKAELETLKRTLEANIPDLEAKLGQSEPNEEVDSLRARLEELESRLSESIPKREAEAELERVKSDLHGKVQKLEMELSGSKSTVDSIRTQVGRLKKRLGASIPKAESEARVKELESELSEARRDLEVTKATIEDFAGKFSQSSAKIDELELKLSNSVPRAELETIKEEAESKITKLESELAVSVPRIEADALSKKANGLEAALDEMREKLNSAEARNRDLELRLAPSRSEIGVLKEELAVTTRYVAHHIKAWLSLYVFYYELIRSLFEHSDLPTLPQSVVE